MLFSFVISSLAIIKALTLSPVSASRSVVRRDNASDFQAAASLINQNLAFEICIIANEAYLAGAALGLVNNFDGCVNPLPPIPLPTSVINIVVTSTSTSSSTTPSSTTTTPSSSSSTSSSSTSMSTFTVTTSSASPVPTTYVVYGKVINRDVMADNRYSGLVVYLTPTGSITHDILLAGNFSFVTSNGRCSGIDMSALNTSTGLNLIDNKTGYAVGISTLSTATTYNYSQLIGSTSLSPKTSIWTLNCGTGVMDIVSLLTPNFSTALCRYGIDAIGISQGYSCYQHEDQSPGLFFLADAAFSGFYNP